MNRKILLVLALATMATSIRFPVHTPTHYLNKIHATVKDPTLHAIIGERDYGLARLLRVLDAARRSVLNSTNIIAQKYVLLDHDGDAYLSTLVRVTVPDIDGFRNVSVRTLGDPKDDVILCLHSRYYCLIFADRLKHKRQYFLMLDSVWRGGDDDRSDEMDRYHATQQISNILTVCFALAGDRSISVLGNSRDGLLMMTIMAQPAFKGYIKYMILDDQAILYAGVDI
jgi:hypothetical protein